MKIHKSIRTTEELHEKFIDRVEEFMSDDSDVIDESDLMSWLRDALPEDMDSREVDYDEDDSPSVVEENVDDMFTDWLSDVESAMDSADDYEVAEWCVSELIYTADIMEYYSDHRGACDDALEEVGGLENYDSLSDAVDVAVNVHRGQVARGVAYEFLGHVKEVADDLVTEYRDRVTVLFAGMED